MNESFTMRIFECVLVVQCEIDGFFDGGDQLVFRIEVLKDIERTTRFKFNVARMDSYRLTPSFPIQETCGKSDERFFVEDLFLWPEDIEITANSAMSALSEAVGMIQQKLQQANDR